MKQIAALAFGAKELVTSNNFTNEMSITQSKGCTTLALVLLFRAGNPRREAAKRNTGRYRPAGSKTNGAWMWYLLVDYS